MLTDASLILLNAVAAVLHATLTAVAMLGSDLGMTVDVYDLAYTMGDTSERFIDAKLEAAREGLALAWIVVGFEAVTCAAHAGNSLLYPQFYLRCVKEARSPLRWAEYAMSASLMVLIVAYMSGVQTVVSLVFAFSLSATTMSFGHLSDLLNRPTPQGDDWTLPFRVRVQPFALGCLPQALLWSGILYAFGRTIKADDVDPPDFVYAIVFLQIMLFLSFAAVHLFAISSPPCDFRKAEVGFVSLSFVSKLVLCAFLFSNVLFVSDYDGD